MKSLINRTFSWPIKRDYRRLAIALSLCLMIGIPSVKAGNGDSHLGLHAGISYPRIFNVQLSYTKENRYHDAVEAYIDYFTQWNDCATCGKVCMDSFWNSKYGISVGGAYKPSVHRGRNSFGRLRMGVDLGTNTRNFQLGIELGYEYVWTLRSGIQLVLEQKNEFNFWAKPTFVNGFLAGVRIPLSR